MFSCHYYLYNKIIIYSSNKCNKANVFFHLRSFALFSVSKYSLDDNQDDNIIIIIKVFFRDVAIRRF